MNVNPKSTTDPAVMRLAHPLRCKAAEPNLVSMLRTVFGERTWQELQKSFQDNSQLTGSIITRMCQNPEHKMLRHMVYRSAQLEGGTELGNAYASLVYLRHELAPQPYFVIDDALVELLEYTDISEDIPIGMLNLPYPRFFIEFGKNRACNLSVPNVVTGLHRLEGVYVEGGIHQEHGEGIFVLLTGSPVGKADAMDDATYSIFLSTANKDQLLKEVLDEAYQSGQDIASKMGLRQATEELHQHSFDLLLFLAKVLLYIGLPEARRTLHQDKTEWQKSIAALKSPAKKAKAEKRGRGLIDHILISAPPPSEVDSRNASESGRTVRAHWRRGHYRMQPHGPQSSLRRLIFIRPALIHGAAGDAPAAHYVVT